MLHVKFQGTTYIQTDIIIKVHKCENTTILAPLKYYHSRGNKSSMHLLLYRLVFLDNSGVEIRLDEAGPTRLDVSKVTDMLDNFLALEAVGFMKLSEELAVARLVFCGEPGVMAWLVVVVVELVGLESLSVALLTLFELDMLLGLDEVRREAS